MEFEASIRWASEDAREKYLKKNRFRVSVSTPLGIPIELVDKAGTVIKIPVNNRLMGVINF